MKSRIKNFVLKKVKSYQNQRLDKSGRGLIEQDLELKKHTKDRRVTVMKQLNIEADANN